MAEARFHEWWLSDRGQKEQQFRRPYRTSKRTHLLERVPLHRDNSALYLDAVVHQERYAAVEDRIYLDVGAEPLQWQPD